MAFTKELLYYKGDQKLFQGCYTFPPFSHRNKSLQFGRLATLYLGLSYLILSFTFYFMTVYGHFFFYYCLPLHNYQFWQFFIDARQDFSYKTHFFFFFYSENNSDSLNRPPNTNLIDVHWGCREAHAGNEWTP